MTNRNFFIIGILFCAFLLGSALFIQFVWNVAPCPLCVIDRIIVIFIAIILGIASLHNPKPLGALLYSAAAFVLSLCGLFVASYHIWLQHLPKDKVPGCGADIGYLFETLPFNEALVAVFKGSGECAKVDFQILGAGLAEMTLISFGMLMIYLGFIAVKNKG